MVAQYIDDVRKWNEARRVNRAEKISIEKQAFRSIDFSNHRLDGVKFRECTFLECKFDASGISNTDFLACKFRDLLATGIIRNTIFFSSEFSGKVLVEGFVNCTFSRSNLQSISLEGVSFASTSFDSCILDHLKLINADLEKVSFSACSWKYASITDSSLRDCSSTTDFIYAKLKSTEFARCSFLTGDFSEAAFADCVLDNSSFSNGKFNKAVFKACEVSSSKLNSCDFTQTNFSNSSFRTANFTESVFSETNINATIISNSKFIRSKWISVTATNTELSSSDFSSASILTCEFKDIKFIKCRSDMAQISSTSLADSDLSGSSFTGAIAPNIDFSGSSLENATATKANFQASNFAKANLKGARFNQGNFEQANFTDSVVTDAKLEGSNFSGTLFERVNLQGTDLRGTIGISSDMLIAAKGDWRTRLSGRQERPSEWKREDETGERSVPIPPPARAVPVPVAVDPKTGRLTLTDNPDTTSAGEEIVSSIKNSIRRSILHVQSNWPEHQHRTLKAEIDFLELHFSSSSAPDPVQIGMSSRNLQVSLSYAQEEIGGDRAAAIDQIAFAALSYARMFDAFQEFESILQTAEPSLGSADSIKAAGQVIKLLKNQDASRVAPEIPEKIGKLLSDNSDESDKKHLSPRKVGAFASINELAATLVRQIAGGIKNASESFGKGTLAGLEKGASLGTTAAVLTAISTPLVVLANSAPGMFGWLTRIQQWLSAVL